MDQLATLTVEREASTPTLSPRPAIQYRHKHNILDLLQMYDAGRQFMTPKNYDRWRDTFALGVSVGGIYYGDLEGNPGLLSVFWRTDNPVVNLAHDVPRPAQDGNYVYVCWLWNSFGVRGLSALKAHLFRTFLGARFVAHHDQRSKVKGKTRSRVEKGRGSGKLIVHPLTGPDTAEFDKMLSERNGHGR